jgi:hypothetical protein
VRAVVLPRAGAVVGARKRLEAVLHVAKTARVEERLPCHAARAPVFLDAVGRLHAELVVELPVRERAQRVLVEDRDLAPVLRVLEAIEIDAAQPRLPERRLQRLLHRRALPLRLDAADFTA